MIAGKAAGLIDDLAAHAEKTAVRAGTPFKPSRKNHRLYLPLIEKYILLEQSLNSFFAG
jgi:hypothetical protein